jgi:hypothetical protein
VEYTLTLEEAQRCFQLSIRLVTVHLKTQPLLLTVTNSNDTSDGDDVVMVASIVVPYTVGEWQLTDPVEIELGHGTNVLTLERQTPNFGLSMKELILTVS